MPQGSKINRNQHYDANLDRGYARLTPKFHKPRSFMQYPEPLEHDEEASTSIDDNTYLAVIKKLLSYTPGDSYAKNATDPFHFVDGATKITELTTAKGMVPFPKMYSSKQAVSGGSAPRGPGGPTASFRTRIRPTGTKRGFSQSPYPEPSSLDIMPADTLTDIMSTDFDQKHVDLIKRMVNLIHLEQEQQKVSSRTDIYN
jgi:hypothetical protein